MCAKFRDERDAIHIWGSSVYREESKPGKSRLKFQRGEQDMQPSKSRHATLGLNSVRSSDSALMSLHVDTRSSDSSQPPPLHNHHPHCQTKCLSPEPTGSGDLTDPGQEATLETPGCIASGSSWHCGFASAN